MSVEEALSILSGGLDEPLTDKTLPPVSAPVIPDNSSPAPGIDVGSTLPAPKPAEQSSGVSKALSILSGGSEEEPAADPLRNPKDPFQPSNYQVMPEKPITPLSKEEFREEQGKREAAKGTFLPAITAVGRLQEDLGKTYQRTPDKDPEYQQRYSAGEAIAQRNAIDEKKVRYQGTNPVITPDMKKGLQQYEVEDLFTYLSDKKKGSQVQKGKEIEASGKKNLGYMELFNPYVEANLQDDIIKIQQEKPSIINSLRTGNVQGAADEFVFDAFLSGDDVAIQKAMTLRNQLGAVAGDQQKQVKDEKVFGKELILSTAQMLPMMAKGAYYGAIPVVGPLLSTSMWARQGAGEILADMEKDGVPREVALPVALNAGLAYSLIESAQVGQIKNIDAVKKVLNAPIKKKLLYLAKAKGWDWVKENIEEVNQSLIQVAAVDVAKEKAGMKIDSAGLVKKYRDTVVETFKQSAGPMGLLSILGLGAGSAKLAGEAIGKKGTEKPAEIIPEVFKADAPAEKAKVTTEKPVENIQKVVPQKTLKEFSVKDEEFWSLPDDKRNEIFSQLPEEERDRLQAVGDNERTVDIEVVWKRIAEVDRDEDEKGEILNVELEPTDGQKEAGNYRKGHIRKEGFDITIENPAQSPRKGTDPDGKPWETIVKHDYGYILGTKGADGYRNPESGDQVDVFINPGAETKDTPVYVVDQIDPKSGNFDEHKVLMGFANANEAKKAYLSNYDKDWKGFDAITELSLPDFKEWVYSEATKDPIKNYVIPQKKETGTTEKTLEGTNSTESGVVQDAGKETVQTKAEVKSVSGRVEDKGQSAINRGERGTPALSSVEDDKYIVERMDDFLVQRPNSTGETGKEVYATVRKAIEEKDINTLYYRMTNFKDSDGSRIAFQGITGLGVPNAAEGTERILTTYFGKNAVAAAKKDVLTAAAPQIDASRFKKQEFFHEKINDLIERGYNKFEQKSVGGNTVYRMYNKKLGRAVDVVNSNGKFIKEKLSAEKVKKGLPVEKSAAGEKSKSDATDSEYTLAEKVFGENPEKLTDRQREILEKEWGMSIEEASAAQGEMDDAPVFARIKKDAENADFFGYNVEDTEVAYGTVEAARKVYNDVEQQLSLLDDLFGREPDTTGNDNRGQIPIYGSIEGLSGPFKSAVAGDWKKHGRIDLVGLYLHNPNSVATYFSVYRHPRLEHFHIVFIDSNNKILAHNTICSGLIDQTIALQYPSSPTRSINALKKRMERLGATGYYLIHNHPSGNITPSTADGNVTGYYEGSLPGFKGHVILDHGKFTLLKDGAASTGKIAQESKYSDPEIGRSRSIFGPVDVATLAYKVLTQEQAAAILYLDTSNRIVAWEPLSIDKYGIGSVNHQLLYDKGSNYGSRSAIIVANKESIGNMFYRNLGTTVELDSKYNILKDVVVVKDTGEYVKDYPVFFDAQNPKDKSGTGSGSNLRKVIDAKPGKSMFIHEEGEGYGEQIYSPEFSRAFDPNNPDIRFAKGQANDGPGTAGQGISTGYGDDLDLPRATDERAKGIEKRLGAVLERSAGNGEGDRGRVAVISPKGEGDRLDITGLLNTLTGKEVVWIKTDPSLNADLGFSPDGIAFPREISPELANKVFINVNSSKPALWVAGHELWHFLEQNQEYNASFWNTVRVTAKGRSLLSKMAVDYKSAARSEFAADIVGEMITDPEFWEVLEKQDANLFDKIVRKIIEVLSRLSNGLKKRFAGTTATPEYTSLIENVDDVRQTLARILSSYHKGRKDGVKVDAVSDIAAAVMVMAGPRQEVAPADMFFSPLLKAVRGLKQEKGTGEQFFNMLTKTPGVKEAEWKWMGLDDFLKGKKSVTRGEIEEFVRGNEVRVEETTKGAKGIDDRETIAINIAHTEADDKNVWEEFDTDEAYPFRDTTHEERFNSLWDAFKDEYLERADAEIDRFNSDAIFDETPVTKYQSYILPGGENYREVLLTLPEKDTSSDKRDSISMEGYGQKYSDLLPHQKEFVDRILKVQTDGIGYDTSHIYKSSHWDEPNVVAHTRLNDRNGPDGEKVLFVEEIQSDWEREAREKGVVGVDNITSDELERYGELETKAEMGMLTDAAEVTEYRRLTEVVNNRPAKGGKVPNQPFLKNWQELTLKRILRMAAEEGYDRVAWINGTQTADRYDLSKQIDKVTYNPRSESLRAYNKNGTKVLDEYTAPEKIQDYIGKEPAKRLLESPLTESVSEAKGSTFHTLEGADLKIGGEWAFNLYDRMVPQFLNKYGKKWGAQVESVALEGVGEQQSIPVTDKMRDDVLYEGQPLFARSKSPLKSKDAVKQAKADFTAEKERVAELEREMNQMRGRLLSLPQDRLLERAEINLKIKSEKLEELDQIKNLILNYAKKIGIDGIGYNKVASWVASARGILGLEKAVKVMDQVWEVARRVEAVDALEKILEKEYLRINAISSGRRKSTIAPEYNVAIKKYLDDLTNVPEKKAPADGEIPFNYKEWANKIINYYNNYALKDLRKDSQKKTKGQKLDGLPEDIVDWMEDPSKPVPDKISLVIKYLFKHTISTMTTDEIKKVLDDIESLRATGRTVKMAKDFARELELNQRADAGAQVIKDATKDPSSSEETFLQAAKKNKLTRWEWAGKLAEKGLWSLIDVERMTEWLSGFKNIEVLKNNILQPLYNAEKAKLDNMKIAHEDFQKRYKNFDMKQLYQEKFLDIDFKTEYEAEELVYSGKESKISLTLNQGMFIYANSLNPGNRAHLMGMFGTEAIAKRIIARVVEKLPQKYKDVIDQQLDYYDNVQYYRMNTVFQNEHEVPLPKEEKYFPIQNVKTDRAESAVVADFLARYSSRWAGVQKGMTKMRVSSQAPFRQMDYLGTVVRNILQTEHYLAYNDSVREVQRFLNHKEVRAAIEDKNEEVYSQLKEWLKAVAYGRVGGGENILDKVTDFMRGNFSIFALGLRLTTAVQQLASLPRGMGYLDKKTNLLKSSSLFMKNPIAALEFAAGKSGLMASRKNSYERELAEAYEKGSIKQFAGLQNATGKLKEWSMRHIGLTDRIVATVLWNARYQEGIDKGLMEAEAVSIADELIRKTQSRGGVLYMPAIYRGGGISRAFLMFSSDLNQSANLLFEIAGKWKIQPTQENLAQIALFFMIPTVVIYIVNNALRLDEPEDYVSEFVHQFAGAIPFLGPLIDASIKATMDVVKEKRGLIADKTWTNYVGELSPAPLQFVESLAQGIGKGKPEKFVEAGAQIFGIPYAAPKSYVQGTMKFVSGDVPNWRSMLWGKRKAEERTVYSSMAKRLYKPRPRSDDTNVYSKWYKALDKSEKEAFRVYVREEYSPMVQKQEAAKIKRSIEDAKKKARQAR